MAGTGAHVWSVTAATNSNADDAINFPEGQSPGSLNDGTRGMMAKLAEYLKDTSGSLTTAGTSTAFTIAPNATFASLTEMSGQKLTIRFNATNGAAPTLNVASLGAKAIQTASGTAVATGAILADSIHTLTFDNSIPAWLLSGAFTGGWAYSGNVTVGGTFGVTGASTLAALSATTGAFSSTLAATGNFAINTDKFTVTAVSGNTLVAGTLSVTGDFAVNTNKFTVTASSGNALIAGTLTVTGASTFTGVMTGRIGLFHVRDEKAANTQGGTFTAGDWRTRDLNTELTNEITGASLAANQMVLPAGTYEIDASAPSITASSNKLRLRNITDGADLLVGQTADSTNSVIVSTLATLRGRFTLAAQKTLELQHRCAATNATDGFGAATNFGVVEVFADVMIRKVG